MRYLRFTLLPFLLVACTDTQAPPEQQPEFSFTNGKEVIEQADIYRFDDQYWIWTNDGVLWAAHLDAINNSLICDPNAEGSVWHEQLKGDIYTWFGEAIRYVAQVRDAPVTIYPYIPPAERPWVPFVDEYGEVIPASFEALCNFFDTGWLYRGTHNLTQTDNDMSGDDDTPGRNTWSWTANGKVMDAMGNVYTYHERRHTVFDVEACDAGDMKHCWKSKGTIRVH